VSDAEHSVEAVADDEKGECILIFASESNRRVAALLQYDLQFALDGLMVLVV
jgi:hypothetical protein